MKKDIAIRWVEALRSGKYGQAQTQLKDGDNYCCLGVLCEITQDRHAYRFDGNTLRCEDEAEREILPDSIRGAFGITLNQQDDFTGMNDDMGMSFAQIADYIQAKFIDETFEFGPTSWCEKNQIGEFAPDPDEVPAP